MISLEKHDSTSARDRILQTERYGHIAARDPQVMSGTIFRMLQNHWSELYYALLRGLELQERCKYTIAPYDYARKSKIYFL